MAPADRLPGPLVTGDWLHANLHDVVVVDTRWYLDGASGAAAYALGHVPGAVWIDLDRDLSDAPGAGGRHPLPSPERFARAMSRLGISSGDAVVAYDDCAGMVAARLWWMLDAIGETAAVLDGGLDAWPGQLSVDEPSPSPGRFQARPWPSDRFADADDVARAIDEAASSTTVLIDARSDERYRGEPNAIDPRFGHIPGARSMPWTSNVDAAGYHPPTILARQYADAGIEPATPVVAYCGSGVSACHDLLALRLIGNSSARLYTGSWSEWGADHDRPVETGPDPSIAGGDTANP